jgi:hypothetical protein
MYPIIYSNLKYGRQMGESTLGGTTRNHLKELVKESKTTNLFFLAFFLKCFLNYKLLFFHVF